jgi:hypothetical protein
MMLNLDTICIMIIIIILVSNSLSLIPSLVISLKARRSLGASYATDISLQITLPTASAFQGRRWKKRRAVLSDPCLSPFFEVFSTGTLWAHVFNNELIDDSLSLCYLGKNKAYD